MARSASLLWLAASAVVLARDESAFAAQLQDIANNYSNVTGLPIQIAYVDASLDVAVVSDVYGTAEGRAEVTVGTPFLFGSGVKPLVGARVMQLVEAGVLSLDDKAAKWMDPVLDAMNGTSFVALFGADAADVTVGQLVRMSSGIADYDVPDVDDAVIDAANVTSPLDILYMFPQRSQFACKPGTCVSYSSTNFLLAGFVLLGAQGVPAAELRALGDEAWTALDQQLVLGKARSSRFGATSFIDHGAMRARGLPIPGYDGVRNGTRQQVWEQDGSILGWTCGNLLTSARDYARFLWDLLADPTNPIVSAASRAAMSDVRPLDVGWAARALQYGTGLMVQSVSRYDSHAPFRMNGTGAFLGHGGETYGFGSNSGFFPLVNASISVALAQTDIAQDVGGSPSRAQCNVLEAAALLLHGQRVSLGCSGPEQRYSCVPGGPNATKALGQCVQDHRGVHRECEAVPNTANTCKMDPGGSGSAALAASAVGRPRMLHTV